MRTVSLFLLVLTALVLPACGKKGELKPPPSATFADSPAMDGGR